MNQESNEKGRKVTISVFKADVGGPGHMKPFPEMIREVREFLLRSGCELFRSVHVSATGDDITIIMGHHRGPNDVQIHKLAWEAFLAGTDVAKKMNAYAAGQDLFNNAFCGNLAGMGPQIIEMEMEERTGETFVLLCLDKTRAGALNGPLRRAFADVNFNTGLLHSGAMQAGYIFEVQDNYFEGPGERVIRLNSAHEMAELTALLVNDDRYVIKSILSAATGETGAMVSTFCLDRNSETHVGKDDPVALMRVQGVWPALGDVLNPFSLIFLVAGGMRGSHRVPLMPVKIETCVSDSDGPAVVSAQVFCTKGGVLTNPSDAFDQPTWDEARRKASKMAAWLRSIEPDGTTLPPNEIEYHGIHDTVKRLQSRFLVINKPAGQ